MEATLLSITQVSKLLTLTVPETMRVLKLAPPGVVIRLDETTRVHRERLLTWLNDGAKPEPQDSTGSGE